MVTLKNWVIIMNLQGIKKFIVLWLSTIALMIFSMVVIGGITRLTESGLSMVKWEPITGVLPPLDEETWQKVFDEYKKFPEFTLKHSWMELEDFKGIFFWEYLHRLIGRLIGIVYFLPLVYIWRKKLVEPALLKKLVTGFILGGLQGLMGWVMVKSGLVNEPNVSHYRLAAHLLLAFAICAYLLWIILELVYNTEGKKADTSTPLFKGAVAITGGVTLQILYGAFTAGKKAGFGFNTFPKMGNEWFPEAAFTMSPFISNFFENQSGIQLIHRLIAWVLILTIPVYFVRIKNRFIDIREKMAGHMILGMLGVQFLLGVLTILFIHQHKVLLPSIHQVGAFILFLTAIHYTFVVAHRTR